MGQPLNLHHWQRLFSRGDFLLFDDFNNASLDGTVLNSVLDYGPYTSTSSHSLSIEEVTETPLDQAMLIGDGNGSIYLTANLPKSFSLDNPGDFIQMEFGLRTVKHSGGNRCLRYGFYQGGENNDNEALGYFMAGANFAGSDSNTQMVAETSTSSNRFYTANESGGQSVQTITDGTVFYPCSFRIERLDATTLLVTGKHANVFVTATRGNGWGSDPEYPDSATVDLATTGTVSEFDEIWFGVRNRDTDFAVNNLKITSNK